MPIISSNGNFSISSDFGATISEGSHSAGTLGTVISFSFLQKEPVYKSLYWKIEPAPGSYGSYDDFWKDFSSNKVGGEPADDFSTGRFGLSASIKINPDLIFETDEQFVISFYDSVLDRSNGIAPVISASFTILNDDGMDVYGTPGADELTGTAFADSMRGGAGDDTYVVNHASDLVFEAAGQGRDTVVTTVSYRLAAGQQIEVLQALDAKGTAALQLTGNEIANDLVGNAGGNGLDGGLGADTMSGGAGNDTYIVDNARDGIVEGRNQGTDSVVASVSYTLADNVEKLTLSGTKAINATGNGLGNHLVGNGAANVLDGKGGIDVMEGGAGNDVYRVDHASDRVIEAVGGGRDTVVTTVSYRLAADQQIETLQTADIDGKVALKLTGNAFGNTLVGNAGDNVLDGGAGIDAMRGGAGNDTYVVDHAKDLVVEAAGGGTDTVLSFVSYTLKAGQEIESLRLTSTAGSANLTGNEFGQSLTGSAGANVLDGGLGHDVLTGGKGADTFVFASPLGSNNVDRITDFTGADTIRLSKSLFAALAPGELKASAFKDIGKTKIDADDHILYDSRNGNLFYDADGSGKGAAVKFAVLDNKAALTHADLLIA